MKKQNILILFLLLLILSSNSNLYHKPNFNIVIQNNHSIGIRQIVISPNGDYFATAGEDKTIKIWNMRGILIRTIKGFNSGLFSIDWSPDGKYIVSGESEVKLWDFQGNLIHNIKPVKHGSVYVVQFSPDGKYIACSCYGSTIKIYNLKGELINIFKGHSSGVASLAYSPDGKYIVSCGQDKDPTVKLWNSATGEEIITLKGNKFKIESIKFSPDGKYIAGSEFAKDIIIWDLKGKIVTSFKKGEGSTKSIAFFPNGKYLLGGYKQGIGVWDLNGELVTTITKYNSKKNYLHLFTFNGNYIISTGRHAEKGVKIKILNMEGILLNEISQNIIPIRNVSQSKDGHYILDCFRIKKIWNKNGSLWKTLLKTPPQSYSKAVSYDKQYIARGNYGVIKIYNKKDKLIKTIRDAHKSWITSLEFSPASKYLISTGQDGLVKIWTIKGELIRILQRFSGTPGPVKFFPDNKKFVCAYSKILRIWNSDGTLQKTIYGHSSKICSIVISPDGKIFASGSWDNTIKIWTSEGELIRTLEGHSDEVVALTFLPQKNYLLSGCRDGTAKIWNISTGYNITLLSKNNNWITYTSDGYFDCSKNGGYLIAMEKDNIVFGIDQFALKYNRPDIILKRMGSKNQVLINHFHNQYQKRLKRMGFTEGQLKDDLHVPEVQIIKINQDGKHITLQFQMKDTKYDIKQYNIYINDVPLFGQYGKKTHGRNITAKEKIELTSGENKIEVTCINKAGAESYRALTHAVYDKKIKGDLYFIGFGVSKYKNPEYNLKYAHKDVMDLSDVYSKMKKLYNYIHIKTFLNENVTIDNIKNVKQVLKRTTVDDTVVLFIAGHGVHDSDKEETYYYLTYNADINNLKKTSAPFKMMENILQGIAPRKKLFLIDTCESGELDEKIQDKYFAKANTRGITARTTRAIRLIRKKKRRNYLYKKDRYIYNDLMRRSGAIVFSSSQGGELSYEKDDYMNGLFTEAIIKGLKKGNADKNYDKIISTDELREYVIDQVSKMSDDLQHPAVDRDNIFQKLSFPVVE